MSAGSDSPLSSTNYLGESQEGLMLFEAEVTDQTVSGKADKSTIRTFFVRLHFQRMTANISGIFLSSKKVRNCFFLVALFVW